MRRAFCILGVLLAAASLAPAQVSEQDFTGVTDVNPSQVLEKQANDLDEESAKLAEAGLLDNPPPEDETFAACAGDKDINGVGTTTTTILLSTGAQDRRVTSIYLASEFACTGGVISGMRYYVSTAPGLPLTNLTIRLRHTTATSYPTPACFDPNAAAWTLCYQATTTISTTGWYTFAFSTTFTYNGVDNLEVDFSFNNASTLGAGSVYSFTGSPTYRTIYSSSASANGDPLLWGCAPPTVTRSSTVPRAQFIFPPAYGACCFADASCVEMFQADCILAGGEFKGHETMCATTTCLLRVYLFDLDTNPGWTMQGEWQYGPPLGLSCGTGKFDPNAAYSGVNVYGYDLTGLGAQLGCYEISMTTTDYLTTAAINCTGFTNINLRFRRWLGVESASFDHVYIDVSNNGTTWTQVWTNVATTINENAWSLQSYDISAVANNQATVYIRWGMGTTDSSVVYQGWNIDDVSIWGIALPPTGACCVAGTCMPDQDPVYCTETLGGIYLGNGSDCDPDPCIGRCCYPDGSCLVQAITECTGVYTPAGTCGPPNPCPQPGACCSATGGCYMSTVIAPGDCVPGDTYWGDNTDCDPNPCPQPRRCCYPDGTCDLRQAADCTALGGVPGAVGSNCDPVPNYVAVTCGNALEDISVIGTPGPTGDDAGVTAAIGFTFNFYGTAYTTVWMCTNGFLQFGGANNTTYTDVALPSTAIPNNMIAVLWDDYNVTGAGQTDYIMLGDPNTGTARFIAQWTTVPQYSGTDANTFQAILYQETGCIELRYGAYATTDFHAGVENSTGTVGRDVTGMVAQNGCISLCPGFDPPCPQPGACCSDAGGCYMSTVTSPGDCVPGDTYWGNNTDCDPNPCPQPGACCFLDGSCEVLLSSDCAALYGTYMGVGTTCSPVNPCPPPCVVCPPEGVLEGEPACYNGYVDNYDGGCNSTPNIFFPIYCGETICGTGGNFLSGTGVQTRDTDWYQVDTTSPTIFTWAVTATFPALIGLIQQTVPGVPGCANITGYVSPSFTTTACVLGSVTTVCMPAGTYYFFVATSGFSGIPCNSPYVATLTCGPCPIGACCYPDGSCAQTYQMDCTGGTWHGEWTTCEPNPCPQVPPNDECATAIPIGEVTDLPFDTTLATTSNIGTHVIYKDIFYCYTASCTGVATIDLCFTPYFDTKLAVWDGCVCPPTVELAYCDDSGPVTCTASTLLSSVKVYVHAGQQYLIQVGAYSSTGGGAGDLTITCDPADYLFGSATDTEVDDDGGGWADPNGLVWFLYPNNWWNQWWPNDFWPYRQKLVIINFTIQYTGAAPVIAFNYASELWLDPVNPPLPVDDAFVVRVPVPTLTGPGTYEFQTLLPFCPRWVSVDIQGTLVWIQGTIIHECLPPVPGACCVSGGICQQLTQEDCLAQSGTWHGGPCVPCMCATCVGDADCNGIIEFEDINPFVAAISGGVPCNFDNCDCNCDGVIDFEDINPFVALISTGTCP
jgi:hypothetical protein